MAVSITQTAAPAGGTGTTITYAGVSIGVATSDRLVAVCVGTELTSGTINSATINSGGGAVAMNASTQGTLAAQNARIFYLAVPTGTTADIAVTYGANHAANTTNRIAVYRVIGADPTINSTNGAGDTDADPISIGPFTIPANGGALAVCSDAANATARTWTGVAEDIDSDTTVFRFGTGFTTTAGSTTITVSGANGEDAGISYVVFKIPVSAVPFVEQQGSFDNRASKVRQRAAGAKGKSEFAFFTPWVNGGWEIQPVQPPHIRRESRGSFLRGDDGIQAEFVAPVEVQIPWFETPWIYPRKEPERWASIASNKEDGNEAPFVFWRNGGWEIQPPQPPHRRTERAGMLPFLSLVDARYVDWKNAGWEIQLPQPPHPRRERAGAQFGGTVDFPVVVSVLQTADNPWLETPWVYPRKHFARWAAVAPKSDGIERPFELWRNGGWEIQHPQPPHPRRERSGAQFGGDFGAYQRPPQALLTSDNPWLETPWVYPRKHFARWAAIAPKSDGIERPFAVWRNDGWQIQPWQPPHLRREARGLFLRGDDGNQNTLPVGLQTASYAWLETPWVYPRKRFSLAGAVVPRSDGNEGRFQFWRNDGWQVQPWQPPHRGTERKVASVFRGDDGTQARFVFWRNAGWEVQPPQPPHPRRERSGLQFGGDVGHYNPAIPPLLTASYAWLETPWVYPRHNFAVAGAIITPTGGHENLFQFVPPPPIIPPRTAHSHRTVFSSVDLRPGPDNSKRNNAANDKRPRQT